MSNYIGGFLMGLIFMWIFAHDAIANECRKLGKFYVGKTVFECTAIQKDSRSD